MKQIAIVLLGMAGNVFAFQPRFQVDYANFAWGYDNKGCLIDYEGNIYKYAYGHSSDGKGLVPAGKMSDADLKFADELADKAAGGVFKETVAAADMGITMWSAHTNYGSMIKLQSKGDYQGKNSAKETDTLITLIDGYCQF